MKENATFKNIFKLLSVALALLVISFFSKTGSTYVPFSLGEIFGTHQANADEPNSGGGEDGGGDGGGGGDSSGGCCSCCGCESD